MSKGAWTALPPGPLALTPGFVNHDCVTAESWSTGASPSQGSLVATGYLCSGSVCALHLKKPPGPPDGGEAESRCRGVHTEARRPRVCCSGCCASGERRSVLAAPAAPPVSRFPARASPAARGLQEQRAAVWTARRHPPNGWSWFTDAKTLRATRGLFWSPALYLGAWNLRTWQAEGVYMTSLQ